MLNEKTINHYLFCWTVHQTWPLFARMTMNCWVCFHCRGTASVRRQSAGRRTSEEGERGKGGKGEGKGEVGGICEDIAEDISDDLSPPIPPST